MSRNPPLVELRGSMPKVPEGAWETQVLVAAQRDLAREMSEASRRRFLEKYTFEKFAGAITSVIKEAASSNGQ